MIYPLPAKNKLYINLSKNPELNSLTIFDISGKIVYNAVLGKNITPVDITSVKNGFYIIRLSDNERSIIKNIIISR